MSKESILRLGRAINEMAEQLNNISEECKGLKPSEIMAFEELKESAVSLMQDHKTLLSQSKAKGEG